MQIHRRLTVLLLFLSAFSLQAQSTISLDSIAAEPNTTLAMPIYIDTPEQVGLIQLVLEYDSTQVELLEPPATPGPAANGFRLSLVNRDLPFAASEPGANENILLQLAGDGGTSISGTKLLVAFLNIRVRGTLGDAIPLRLLPGARNTFLTTTSLQDIFGQSLALADGHITLQDITRPVTSISTPAANDTLQLPNVLVTGTADDEGGSGLATVEISTDGGLTWLPVVPLGGSYESWQFEWQNILPGSYTLRSRAHDNAGNIGFSPLGHMVFIQFGSAMDAEVRVSSKLSGPGRVQLELAWQPSVGTVDTAIVPVVELIDAGGQQRQATQTRFTPELWQGFVDIDSTFTDGPAALQARGLRGTEGYIYGSVNIDSVLVIDTSPPAAFQVSKPAPDSWTSANRPTLEWQATVDATSGLRAYHVTLDNFPLTGSIPPTATRYTIPIPLAQGTHTWSVQAVDSAGNERSTGVSRFGIDLTAPEVTITQPAAGDTLRDVITIRGSVSDLAGDLPGSGADSVLVSTDGGASWQPAEIDISTGTSWQYRWTVDRDGPIKIIAYAVDRAGNRGAQTPALLVTSVHETAAGQPRTFGLSQPMPNPFREQVRMYLELPQPGPVDVRIFNILGQEVSVLQQGRRAAGRYLLHWDGRNELGMLMPRGVYFAVMRSPGKRLVRRIVLMR